MKLQQKVDLPYDPIIKGVIGKNLSLMDWTQLSQYRSLRVMSKHLYQQRMQVLGLGP